MTKIIHDSADTILKNVIKGMQDKKAKNIVSLDLSNISNSVAGYFVVCDAPSNIQVNAIYENVDEVVKKNCGVRPYHVEGITNSEWILLDYFDVVVHIFNDKTRAFYKLEELWADASKTVYKSDL